MLNAVTLHFRWYNHSCRFISAALWHFKLWVIKRISMFVLILVKICFSIKHFTWVNMRIVNTHWKEMLNVCVQLLAVNECLEDCQLELQTWLFRWKVYTCILGCIFVAYLGNTAMDYDILFLLTPFNVIMKEWMWHSLLQCIHCGHICINTDRLYCGTTQESRLLHDYVFWMNSRSQTRQTCLLMDCFQ